MCGVLSFPKQCPNGHRSGYLSADAAASGVEECEFESHTDLVPLVSGYVTSGKVFNCPSLCFLLCKVSNWFLSPSCGCSEGSYKKMQVLCPSPVPGTQIALAVLHGVKSDGLQPADPDLLCFCPAVPTWCLVSLLQEKQHF